MPFSRFTLDAGYSRELQIHWPGSTSPTTLTQNVAFLTFQTFRTQTLRPLRSSSSHLPSPLLVSSGSYAPAPLPDQPPLTTEAHLLGIDRTSSSLHRALHCFSPSPALCHSARHGDFQLELVEATRGLEAGVVHRCMTWVQVFIPDRDQCMLTKLLVLYEANRKAHEEAVQNDGLSPPLSLLPHSPVNTYPSLHH
jgi:hypothetical protein